MNVDFPGSDKENFESDGWIDCLRGCKKKSWCRAITFDPVEKHADGKKNYCWHKTQKFEEGGAASPSYKDYLLSANIDCFDKPFVPALLGE